MTTELSTFAARLRAFITASTPDPAGGHDGEFETLALELFALQFDRNAPYRRFCEARCVTPLVTFHGRARGCSRSW